MKILIDTNIIMDFLCKRPAFFENANTIIKMCADKQIEGVLAGHTLPTIFYLLRKDIPDVQQRRNILLGLCSIFEIGGINKSVIQKALKDISFDDFEDCIQNVCAEESFADYIITRNKPDFEGSKITVLTPAEFLNL